MTIKENDDKDDNDVRQLITKQRRRTKSEYVSIAAGVRVKGTRVKPTWYLRSH